MKGKLGDQQRIRHILDAISEIESYLKGIDRKGFSKNSMMRFAIVKQLEIIGEACNHISEETKSKTAKLNG
ncbi:MAG: HepT-like ribonuclease domain-containing protein [Chitinophagales bacterium]